jgi:hypothetical protein
MRIFYRATAVCDSGKEKQKTGKKKGRKKRNKGVVCAVIWCAEGTVTFFIQTFFIRDKVYTNFLYTGQSLYGTKFIQDKVYTGTKFIWGQSLYGDKVYMGQSLYGDKVYTGTKFIQT